jgi:hypothetical protein
MPRVAGGDALAQGIPVRDQTRQDRNDGRGQRQRIQVGERACQCRVGLRGDDAKLGQQSSQRRGRVTRSSSPSLAVGT